MNKKLHRKPNKTKLNQPNEFKPQKSRYIVLTENYIIPLVVIISVISLIAFVYKSSYFKIKNINCTQLSKPCDNQFIIAELSKYKNKNIFLIDKDFIKSRLENGSKTTKSVSISTTLPNTLSVEITPTTPKLALKFVKQDRYILFDNEARAISISNNNSGLPILITDEPYKIQIGTEVPDPNLKTAILMATTIHGAIRNIKSIHLKGETITINIANNIKALITTNKKLKPQLKSLQAILSNATMLGGDSIKIIDVRFDQPVIKSN